MSRERAYIPLTERYAAALACLLPQDVRDDLRRRRVSAKVVIAMFEVDHIELHAHDGSDRWHNLDPRPVAEHREKSRRDTSIVAKSKRLSKEHEEFRRRMMRRAEIEEHNDMVARIERSVSRWPQGRKIQQRKDPWPKRSIRSKA